MTGIADGDQRRDFIYVDDAVAVLRWLLGARASTASSMSAPAEARSFRDMIGAMFKALGRPAEYRIYRHARSDPRAISIFHRKRASRRLRHAGYNAGFTPLEAAVDQYVTGYLDREDRYR